MSLDGVRSTEPSVQFEDKGARSPKIAEVYGQYFPATLCNRQIICTVVSEAHGPGGFCAQPARGRQSCPDSLSSPPDVLIFGDVLKN